MLIRYWWDWNGRGSHINATRALLREIAVARSWTMREVIATLRAGECIEALGWRYLWSDRQ